MCWDNTNCKFYRIIQIGLNKLVSVFNYLCQRFSDKKIHNSELRNSTLTQNWPSFTAAVRDNNPLPTWKQFLEIVATNYKVGDF